MIIELLALLLGVLILSLAVYHVAQFSTKETPFEEAIAEQRRNKNLEIITPSSDKNQKKTKITKKMRARREDSHSSHSGSRSKPETSSPVPVHQPTKTKTRDLPPKEEEDLEEQPSTKPTYVAPPNKNRVTSTKPVEKIANKKESSINLTQEKQDKKKVEVERKEEVKKPKKEEEKGKKKEEKRQKSEEKEPQKQGPGKTNQQPQGQGKAKVQQVQTEQEPKRKPEGSQGEKKPPKPQGQSQQSSAAQVGGKSQSAANPKGGSGTPTSSPKRAPNQQSAGTGGMHMKDNETIKEQMAAVVSTQLNYNTNYNNNNNNNIDKKKRKEIEDRKKILLISDDSLSKLLGMIQKTNLSDGEIQVLIETLLNKQQLSGGPGGEWVEKGRVDPMIQLKKQLEESEARLKEQLEAQQALSAKIADMRAELNTERGRNSGFKKQLDISAITLQQKLEAAACAHKEQMATALKEVSVNLGQEYQTKLIQHQTAARREGEANLQQTQQSLAEAETQLREARLQLQEAKAQLNESTAQLNESTAQLQETQSQCQQAKGSAADIESRLDQLQQEKDAQLQKVTAEREELVNTCQQYQQHLAALKEQCSQQAQQESAANARLFEVQQKLTGSEAAHSQVMLQLNQLLSEKEMIQQQLNNQDNIRDVYAQTQVKLKKIGLEKSDLESRLVRAEKDLSAQRDLVRNQKSEIERLNEEKDSLASQSVRPAAEGRENGDLHPEGEDPQVDHVLNNQFHSHKTELHEEQISALTKEVSRLKEEAISLSKRSEDAHESFEKLEENTKSVLIRIFPELHKAQHFEPVAFLKEAESASAAAQKVPVEVKTEFVEKIVEKVVQDPNLLQELEDIKKQNSELSVKIEELKAANTALEERLAASSSSEVERDSGSDSHVRRLEEENQSLAEKVSNYQDILANTESLLKTLQKSVESEESTWHEQNLVKEKQIRLLLEDKKNLTLQVDQLQKSLDTVKQAEEMESQLNSLKEKLGQEEEAKGALQEQLNKAQEQLKAVNLSQVSANGPANGVDTPPCNEDDLSQADSTSLVSAEGFADEPNKKKKKKTGSPTITE